MRKIFWKRVLMASWIVLLWMPATQVLAATKWITIPSADFVIDSYHGVDALYTNEKNADADEKYSCAAYVKKYYNQIYHIGVFNLMDEGPPVVRDAGVGFERVSVPKEGDLVFWPTSTNGNNHSAIIKKVEGSTITLIEQNYKTGVVAALDRTITYPSNKFQIFRLKGNIKEDIPENDNFTPSIGPDEPIHISMDDYAIPVICERFRFGVISGVEGDQYSQKQILDNDKDAQSYELNSDTKFSFTLDTEQIEGWYLDGNVWKEIKDQQEVTAQRAYFTIYNSFEVDAELPGLADETVPAFREDKNPFEPSNNPPDFSNALFNDVQSDHWAYESIKKCSEMGLLTGFEDGSFQPDKILNRAEFAVLLAKASGAQITQYVNTEFLDVAPESWYSGFVAYGKEFLPGKNGYYYPLEGATRQDVCEAVLKALKFSNLNVDTGILDLFSDGNKIRNENRSAVAFAVEIELMKGFEDGSFKPDDALTRAQAAVIFAKMY